MRRSLRSLAFIFLVRMAMTPSPVLAWGAGGHRVIAEIARSYLKSRVLARVDAILATDADPLTRPDMADRATWADAWRLHGHRETAAWHYVDIELDHPDMDEACYGHPHVDGPASAGTAQECLVDKIEQLVSELKSKSTPAQERLLALKYLLHFVGDLHQPLHVSDNHDRGGNCVRLSLGGSRTVNLHGWWDTVIVRKLGSNPDTLAAHLESEITPARKAEWERGDPRSWAMEGYRISRVTVYGMASRPGCSSDSSPVSLPVGYEGKARVIAAEQLEKAGVRLAWILTVPRALIADAIDIIVFIAGRGAGRRVDQVLRVAGVDPDGGFNLFDLLTAPNLKGV